MASFIAEIIVSDEVPARKHRQKPSAADTVLLPVANLHASAAGKPQGRRPAAGTTQE